MAAIVQSTIGALGYKDNRGVYHREPDCYESVRDLITFLRNDNQKTYRKICGTQNIVKTDLVPIMTDKSTPENLFDVALRLTINLCQPVVLVYRGEMPDSNEDWKMYMDLEANLRRSKAGFASVDFMKVLLKKIKKYFRMEWEIRSEAQKMIIERIMLLLKYALAIDSSENDKQRTSEDMNTHDRVVMAFLEAGLGPALIDIACNKYERDFHLHTLEIIALLLKEHKPVDIYQAGTEKQREADTAQLQKAVDQEKSKLLSKKRQVGSRHSGFAGAFTVKGLKAVNKENDMVVQRVVKDANSVNHLTERKNRLKASKKECTIDKAPTTHLSSEAVRVALKNFYEILMPSAFALLLKNAKEPAFGTQTLSNRNSDVHYFLAMRLGLEYAYLADLSFSFVEDVVTKNGFHHVQQTVFDFIDKMKVNKTEAKMIGAKSQYAVAALKELTICLNHYITKGTENIRELVKEIANDLLKLEEYRDTGFDMLKMFVPYAMPKQVLRDMVVFVHYYVRIMERSYKEGELRVVSKTAKVRSQRQNKKKAVEAEREQAETIDFLPADELVAIWDEQVAKSLTEVLNGEGTVDEDVVVIDALLKVSTKQEMSFAMLLIQRALREGDVSRAVGLHRGARELWPEGMFGKEGINPEEEFAELREVFNSDLSVIAGEYATERAKVYETSEFIEGGGELSEEDSEEQDQYLTKEINFDFKEYVIKFGRPEILRWYSLLFADYDKNPSEVNKCILKMMHRIAFDFSEPSRLYHVSVFSTLLNIRDELKNLPNSAIKNHKHCELYRFGIHLLRKFMSTWKERGGKLIPELLFWKTSSEVFDIENGYGAFDKDRSRKGILWPEELEDEVEKLHEEFMGFEDKPQGMDVADFIEHNLSETRNRKQILKLLKKLSMDMGDLRITKKFTSGKPDIFTAEVTENMKVWVEQFKEIKEKDEEMEEVKDVVEYIQMRLPEIASRSKIMKQLKYCGIEIGSKRGWSSDMDNELRSLKEEYDAGVEAFSGDLLDYIVLKINGTKSRGQVKSRLQKLNIEFQTVRKTAKMRRAIEAGYDDDFRKELDAILELPDYEERETRPRSRSPELELDFSDLSDAESTSGDSGPAKEDLKSPHPDDEGLCKSEQSDEPKEDRVDDDDDVSFSPNARKRVRVMLSDDENDIEEPVAISRKRSLSEVLTTMSGDEDAGGMAAPTSPKRKRVVISDDEDSD